MASAVQVNHGGMKQQTFAMAVDAQLSFGQRRKPTRRGLRKNAACAVTALARVRFHPCRLHLQAPARRGGPQSGLTTQ